MVLPTEIYHSVGVSILGQYTTQYARTFVCLNTCSLPLTPQQQGVEKKVKKATVK